MKNSYLIDTNVLSETRKKKPNYKVINWLENSEQIDFFISVLTIGELQKGIEKGKKLNFDVRKLEKWLSMTIIPWFSEKTINIDISISKKWAKIITNNRTLPLIDSLLASTAIVNNLTLATRNTKDFKDIKELKLFNPWEYAI